MGISDDKFAVMFQASPIGMSLSTFKEGRLLDVNESWLNLLGIKRSEDAIGKTTVELGLVPDEETRDNILQGFNESDRVQNIEVLSHIKNGSRNNLLVKKKMVQVSGLKYILSTVEDISDRKYAEQRSAWGQMTFSELVEMAPFGVYVIDSDFRIAQMNLGSQNGAFKNVRPLLGRPFSESMHILWPDSVAEGIIALFRNTLDTGESYYSPLFINTRNDTGTVESYEWELHRIMLPDGHFGVICYFFDSTRLREAETALRNSISDLKLKEIELKENESKLKELIVTKDKFFNIVAHDLKNPFTSMIGSSELLSQNIDQLDNDKIKVLAHLINDASKHGYGILLNLLEWSRSQTGTMIVNPEKFNLRKLVEEQMRNHNHLSTNKEITMSSLLQKDVFIKADKNIINTILRNLISNAVKFSNRKSKIIINASQKNGSYVISVRDNGIGIPPEKAKNLFRLETELSTPGTENEQGTGLGLKLCKELVAKIGGEIWVESNGKKGSEFKFSVPTHAE